MKIYVCRAFMTEKQLAVKVQDSIQRQAGQVGAESVSFKRENPQGGWNVRLTDQNIQIRKRPEYGVGIEQFGQNWAL
jgi:hypothetical protein